MSLDNKMIVFMAADHAGYDLKEALKKHLHTLGYLVIDFGASKYDADDDYTDFIGLAARALSKNLENSCGVVIGKSGQGEAIQSNRRRGVRAAVYYGYDLEIVRLSRQHNNSNILSLGARFVSEENAVEALDVWLKTPFAGGRHQRRIDKIDSLYQE